MRCQQGQHDAAPEPRSSSATKLPIPSTDHPQDVGRSHEARATRTASRSAPASRRETPRRASAGQINGMSTRGSATPRAASLTASQKSLTAIATVPYSIGQPDQSHVRHWKSEHPGGINRFGRAARSPSRPKLNTARKQMSIEPSGHDHREPKTELVIDCERAVPGPEPEA